MIAMELLRRIAPYLIAVAVVLGALFGAYHHGVKVTAAMYELRIAQREKDAAAAALANAKTVLAQEQAHAADIADIDSKYQKVIENEKAITNNTINDLQLGTVRLRKQLAAVYIPSASVSKANASAGVGDGTYTSGLRQTDAVFLVRLADSADAVAHQLMACQAIVRSDRK